MTVVFANANVNVPLLVIGEFPTVISTDPVAAILVTVPAPGVNPSTLVISAGNTALVAVTNPFPLTVILRNVFTCGARLAVAKVVAKLPVPVPVISPVNVIV